MVFNFNRDENKMKIDCKNIRKYLSAYLDGEIDEAKKAIIDDHLKCCTMCNSFVNEQKIMFKTIDNTLIETPSFDTIAARRKFWNKVELIQSKRKFLSAGWYGFIYKYITIFIFIVALPAGVLMGNVFSQSIIEKPEYEGIENNFTEIYEDPLKNIISSDVNEILDFSLIGYENNIKNEINGENNKEVNQ